MHTLEMPTNSLGKLGITKTSQLEKRDQGLRTQLVFHGMEICTSGSRLLVFYCRQLNKTVEKEIEVATLTLEFFPQPTMLCINGSSSVFVGCPGTGRRDLSDVTAAGGLLGSWLLPSQWNRTPADNQPSFSVFSSQLFSGTYTGLFNQVRSFTYSVGHQGWLETSVCCKSTPSVGAADTITLSWSPTHCMKDNTSCPTHCPLIQMPENGENRYGNTGFPHREGRLGDRLSDLTPAGTYCPLFRERSPTVGYFSFVFNCRTDRESGKSSLKKPSTALFHHTYQIN